MGDMTSGGAPRIKSIVAYLESLAGTVLGGLVKANLRQSDGTEIGTAANPIYVDIGGNVPDSMNISQVGGTATAVGTGVADAGTFRVAVATDDANLAAIKTAVEKIDDLQDATVAEGIAATKGVQISLDDGLDTQFAQCDASGYLKNTLMTELPAGTQEIGGVNQTKVAGTVVSVNSGVLDAGTQRVAIATDDVNLSAIKTAAEKIDDLQDATVAESVAATKGVQISLDDGLDTQFAQCDASGYLKNTLMTELPAGTQEIGGVNQTKVAGTAVSVNSGVLGDGVQRVAVATDDVNLSAIKTAAEKIDDVQDVVVAEGGVATKGVQICLDDGVDTHFAQCDGDGNQKVIVQTALPAGTNEIGGVDIVKVAGAAPSTAGKIDVLVADGDDVALGTTTDVAVAAGAEGTLSAKLRLVTSQLADAVTALQTIDDWDSGDQCKVIPTAMGYTEANGSGTTDDAYVAAVTIDMRGHNQLKLLLANTDAANSLDYKVICYAKHGGAISVDEVVETAVVAGVVAEVTLTEKWAQVVVQVKSTVASTPATYAYEYIQSVM